LASHQGAWENKKIQGKELVSLLPSSHPEWKINFLPHAIPLDSRSTVLLSKHIDNFNQITFNSLRDYVAQFILAFMFLKI